MSDAPPNESRRGFLSKTGKLALVVGATSAAAHWAAADGRAQDRPRAGRKKKRIIPGSPSKAYSRAVVLDRTVFVAGCVGTYKQGHETAIDPDFEVQASQTLLNLKKAVEDSGSSLGNVLKCTCFLKNVQHFAKFNEIYVKFFPDNPPARSSVIVKDLVVPGALLEVDCVCCID